MILAHSSGIISPAPFFRLLLVSYLLDLFYFVFSRFVSEHSLIWIQIVGDVTLISFITRISGGVDSPHSLLYFLVIIYAAIFLVARGGLFAALGASLSYSLALFISPATSADFAHVAYRLYLHVLLFFLVGPISGFLAERLRKSAAEYSEIGPTTEEILQNILSGLMSLTIKGNISYINRRAEEMLGVRVGEVKGKSFHELPERLSPLKEEIGSHLKRPNLTRRKEIEILDQAGSKKQLGFTMHSFLDSSGKVKGVTVNFQDVTERRYTERLAILVELSASLAHEIRNPLGSIRGATEVLAESLKVEKKDTKKLMELILRESDRVNRKIEEFLFLAKPREPVLRKTHLRESVNQVIALLKYHPGYSRNIKIKREFGRKLPVVKADEGLLRQVFHNISINAVTAMEGRGELTISVIQNDKMIGVSFEDTGRGIEPENVDLIFKPFYSGDGKGVGLGLAIANEIVKQHNGKIEVSSEAGKGSRFIIWIPRG